jgi:hypothetical protein
VLLGLLSQTFLGSIGLEALDTSHSIVHSSYLHLRNPHAYTLYSPSPFYFIPSQGLTDDSTSHLQSNPLSYLLAGDHLVSARGAPKMLSCHDTGMPATSPEVARLFLLPDSVAAPGLLSFAARRYTKYLVLNRR